MNNLRTVQIQLSDSDLNLVTFGSKITLDALVSNLLNRQLGTKRNKKSIHDFIAEEIETDFVEDRVKGSIIYEAYIEWCKTNKLTPKGNCTLYKTLCLLEGVFKRVSTGNTIFIYNLTLKNGDRK